MARLYLLRHSKAEPAGAGQSDHDRPLSERGRRDSEAVGAALAAWGEHPDRVLCSTARRTRQTLDGLRPALAPGADIRLLDSLYKADDYFPVIAMEGGDAAALLVIGHNPTLHRLAAELASGRTAEAGLTIGSSFPTSAVAIFEFDRPWAELTPSGAHLVDFRLPRGRRD